MPAVASSPRKPAAPEPQLEFDWLLGERNFWSLAAAGSLLGLSDSFLERLWDDPQHRQHLGGHSYNAGKGLRMTKRIPRAFLVRLLVTSANYDAAMKRQCVESLAREFNAADCAAIAETFRAVSERKRLRSA
jgi:hypothetical protein